MTDRYAVIDIGSNSIRLVVYGAPLRAPVVLFNEKVMAGLGKGIASTGALEEGAMRHALAALARFRLLAIELGVETPRTVATAAVRQAQNGDLFVARVAALGLPIELLSGDAEAEAAGLGVIAGFEAAEGVVGDLGGGSLELTRVRGGQVYERASFPLGVLRIAAERRAGATEFERELRKTMKASGWRGAARGLPFYLVGGSWRALARIHMHLTRYPLPILHHYEMPISAAGRLVRAVARIAPPTLRAHGIVSGARIPALGDGAALLSTLVKSLQPASLIVSANGVREGLLYQQLDPETRSLDPLIVAARAEGVRQGRFADHGDQLDAWIAPLFADDSPAMQRLRHAACLLGDIGWAANPDFRAERGLEAMLHGNWQGLAASGRALIGQALFSAFGGGAAQPVILAQLAEQDPLARARSWGLAMRLGQRLGAGSARPLSQSRLALEGHKVVLRIDRDAAALAGEAVERRLKQLATAMTCTPQLRVSG